MNSFLTLLSDLSSKFSSLFFSPNTQWSRTSVIRDVKLTDGTMASGGLWVRKVRGIKQYKKMTEDEELQFFVDRW